MAPVAKIDPGAVGARVTAEAASFPAMAMSGAWVEVKLVVVEAVVAPSTGA